MFKFELKTHTNLALTMLLGLLIALPTYLYLSLLYGSLGGGWQGWCLLEGLL